MFSATTLDAKSALDRRLQQFSVFPELAAKHADAAWLETLTRADDVEVPAETVLLCRGDKCHGFLLPWQGTIRVQQASTDGREAVLYRVEPGDICILALTSLLDGVDYRAEAVTETAIKCVSIPSQQFHFALENSRVFRRYVFNIMAKRLRTLCELVEEVRFRRLDNRIACLLYQLFSKSTEQALKITHQDLAQELGSSREVVSRLLKDFEKKGDCIALHRGRIELLSLDKLGQYARTSSG